MPITNKELAEVGIFIAAGCKPCTDYHMKAVRQAGALDSEFDRRFRTPSRWEMLPPWLRRNMAFPAWCHDVSDDYCNDGFGWRWCSVA
jgi:AhpD family alkylhydroperoxidase